MRNCPPCAGTGKHLGKSILECGVCKGEGQLADPQPGEVLCRWCQGSGRASGTSIMFCSRCDGRGYRIPQIAHELVKELGVRESALETDSPCVVYIEAGKPRTAHLEIATILSSLTGDTRICDPYYGAGSLLRLDQIVQKSIRFLTHTPDSKEQSAGTLPRALAEYTRQYPGVEFRRYPTNDLHDRFIVCHSELILLGHGLRDIGGKDSFVDRLNRSLAGDMIDQIIGSFDSKWATAEKLT